MTFTLLQSTSELGYRGPLSRDTGIPAIMYLRRSCHVTKEKLQAKFESLKFDAHAFDWYISREFGVISDVEVYTKIPPDWIEADEPLEVDGCIYQMREYKLWLREITDVPISFHGPCGVGCSVDGTWKRGSAEEWKNLWKRNRPISDYMTPACYFDNAIRNRAIIEECLALGTRPVLPVLNIANDPAMNIEVVKHARDRQCAGVVMWGWPFATDAVSSDEGVAEILLAVKTAVGEGQE